MELEAVLLWVRFAIHVATFLIIFCYNGKGSRQRWGVSFLAICLAGSSVGFACFIAFGVIDPALTTPQWLYIVAFGSVLGLVLRSRGNVAKLLPRRQGSPT